MDISAQRILLIGAGNMGGALAASWKRARIPDASVTIVDLKGNITLDDVAHIPTCIVLAVKPQSMDALLPQLKQKWGSAPLYLSIAAGKTLAYFETQLGHDAAIVRAMPNTPALVGKGISALFAKAQVSEAQKTLATMLLASAGKTLWLENEAQMDAVTALSGSGPAYIFLFLECLIDAGVKQGLTPEMAYTLALETMHGSVHLIHASGDSLSALRQNVTSPGGTTQAALNVLMQDKALNKLVESAITAAVKRAEELS